MSDLHARSPIDSNGIARCSDGSSSLLFSEPSNPLPSSFSAESWRAVERAARDIIWKIQPTKRSEGRRMHVVDYVQRLIRTRLGSEVFPFGSVPLKTYLPDGDIDLTALGPPNYEENLAVNVHAILEEEERMNASAFEIRDVQYIHAEVKLVKCLVQNIVVDISFNQIGGLCTLCFLEQVDSLIGKDHLFKRSAIFIKAWCYYESRILGAPHSLLSTYALETLVLYIFHLFNSSLDGPVAVLYRFLDYFSKFDWDNFCISLRGPVPISSLPEILAQSPETDEGDLLLQPEFLNRCVDMFSVPPRVPENRVFAKKHLNIVDPLKENNNLGRSVSKGNLYRIRSAFAYGARKLGQILLLPSDRMPNELNKFFKNTLERHGDGERPDLQCNSNDFYNRGIPAINSHNGSGLSRIVLNDGLNEANGPISLEENGIGKGLHQESGIQDRCHLTGCYLQSCNHAKEDLKDHKDHLRGYLAGDSMDTLASCEKSDSRDTIDVSEHASCIDDTDAATSAKINHAPHLFFHHENDREIVSSRASQESQSCSEVCVDVVDAETNVECLTSDGNGLVDYSGEHERHMKNLQYAQWCHDYFLNGCVSLGRTLFYPTLLTKQQWDAVYQRNIFRNGPTPSSPFSRVYYQMKPNSASGTYRVEDMPKPRGTGMYLTNPNYWLYRDPPTPGRGRKPFSTDMRPRARSSGPPLSSPEPGSNMPGYEPAKQIPSQVDDKQDNLDSSLGSDLFLKGLPQVKMNTAPPEGLVEFGTFGPLPLSTPSPKPGKSDPVNHSVSKSSPAQQPLVSPNHERSTKSYRLKDEEFPPLSSKGNQSSNRAAWEVRK